MKVKPTLLFLLASSSLVWCVMPSLFSCITGIEFPMEGGQRLQLSWVRSNFARRNLHFFATTQTADAKPRLDENAIANTPILAIRSRFMQIAMCFNSVPNFSSLWKITTHIITKRRRWCIKANWEKLQIQGSDPPDKPWSASYIQSTNYRFYCSNFKYFFLTTQLDNSMESSDFLTSFHVAKVVSQPG